jgi:hypothetical protein
MPLKEEEKRMRNKDKECMFFTSIPSFWCDTLIYATPFFLVVIVIFFESKFHIPLI